MLRAKGNPRGLMSVRLALALVVLGGAAVTPLPLQAGEVPQSTSTGGIRLAQAPTTYGAEDRALELYLDAMEKLDAGLSGPAQNMLGDVVARYPATRAAGLARNRLAEFKGGAASKIAKAKPAVAPANAAEVPARASSRQLAGVGSGPNWDQELRRNGAIQSRLRMDAGDRVFFGAGSAQLGARARMALSAQAQWLKRWNEFEVAIEGHADESESGQDDLRLSQERAEAVRRHLVLEGVKPSRVAVVAQGHTRPVAVCPAAECRAQNRRVVTLVFAAGTNERLGLNAVPMAGSLGNVSAGPASDGRPLSSSLVSDWDGAAR